MIIYQAKPECHQVVSEAREHAYHVCIRHLNRPVRVQRMNGQYLDGTIVHVDTEHVYLLVAGQPEWTRGFFNPFYGGYAYNNVILPLVLFDLLTITLLS